jgi:hypothetical protein
MQTLFVFQITRNLEMKNPDLGAGGVTTASRPTYRHTLDLTHSHTNTTRAMGN